MDDTAFGEHFDELRRGGRPCPMPIHQHSSSQRTSSAVSKNPFIELPSGGAGGGGVGERDEEEMRRWAKDFEEDPFGRAPPLTAEQRKFIRL